MLRSGAAVAFFGGGGGQCRLNGEICSLMRWSPILKYPTFNPPRFPSNGPLSGLCSIFWDFHGQNRGIMANYKHRFCAPRW